MVLEQDPSTTKKGSAETRWMAAADKLKEELVDDLRAAEQCEGDERVALLQEVRGLGSQRSMHTTPTRLAYPLCGFGIANPHFVVHHLTTALEMFSETWARRPSHCHQYCKSKLDSATTAKMLASLTRLSP